MDLFIQHLLEIIPGMTMATEEDMVPGDRQSMRDGDRHGSMPMEAIGGS